jgi:LuxR family transcriptional regulator, maltose regulon positive regulatory protein
MNLLKTKLMTPPLRSNLVSRPCLIEKLNNGLSGQLTLISAPAGFGKTTLVSEWFYQWTREIDYRLNKELIPSSPIQRSLKIAWLSLDEDDNDPIRFLAYLAEAMDVLKQGAGEIIQSLLQSPQAQPPKEILISLINFLREELDEDQPPKTRYALVLDDYHVIKAEPIHEAVAYLLDHQPFWLHLTILTRIDPPLPIPRLRSRRQLTEVRASDLRFSFDEAAAFLGQVMGLEVSPQDVAALEARTEGWIAGLQMAALSMQGSMDIPGFIKTFSGSHRFIIDYLMEEIYNHQPPQIQDFLLRTSFLDRLSGPLCDAVLCGELSAQREPKQFTSAQQILEYLEHANLFLHPMDEERNWYRYHHLFATLLGQRLRLTWPDEIPGLFQKASSWSAAHGTIDEAIKYAQAANDNQTAADLVEDNALGLLNIGSLSTLSGWLGKLPDEIILGRPWLSVFLGWTLLLTGKFDDIERYLAAAEEGQIYLKDRDDLCGHIAAIRAYKLAVQEEADQALRQANDALNLLPEDALSVRSVVAFVLGGIHYLRRDFPNALEAMIEASRIGERAGNIHLAVQALSAAGDLLRYQGNLTEAEKIYEQALKSGTGRSGHPLPIAASVYSSMAELHLTRKDLESARPYAMTGVELARQWGNVDSLASSYLALGYIAQMEENFTEAQQVLDELKRLIAVHRLSPGFVERISAYEAISLQGRPVADDRGFLIDPLTDRELEVLRMMAKGCSNPEIAADLIVALGTVKAHTSSIYRKLDARSRTEAVIKAGALGLL